MRFLVECQRDNNKKEEKKEEFTCPQGVGNGNYADPATCRRFYQVFSYLMIKLFIHKLGKIF